MDGAHGVGYRRPDRSAEDGVSQTDVRAHREPQDEARGEPESFFMLICYVIHQIHLLQKSEYDMERFYKRISEFFIRRIMSYDNIKYNDLDLYFGITNQN